MSGKRKLEKKSVWDVPLVLQAFRDNNVKEMHAIKMWG